MKSLHNLTNIDKANLIHQLFPQEIPSLLEFISSMCITIKEDQELNRKKWDNGFITFEYWLHLTSQVESKIEKRSSIYIKNPKAFSEQLFENHLALFTNHCISVYTRIRQHPDPKFTLAIELIINP
jgi:hypothetical protein